MITRTNIITVIIVIVSNIMTNKKVTEKVIYNKDAGKMKRYGHCYQYHRLALIIIINIITTTTATS